MNSVIKNLAQTIAQTIAPIYPQAKRWLHSFNGGIFPKYHKELSADQPIRTQHIPQKLIIPLQQQVGLPAELLVEVGDKVLANQLIARSTKDASKALVVPVHAPTSGTIIAIEEHTLPHPSGLQDLAVVIAPDQQHQALENVLNVSGKHPNTPDELKKIILDAGIVGMGGAGFPTYAKLPAQKNQVHTIIINGAECEPFITCDDMLMQTQAQRIIDGALITAEALGVETIYFGIETNKPTAIKAASQAAKNTKVEIKTVETVYPMGGQKQLTQELMGIEVPKDVHTIDLGILMMNVATFVAIADAVELGKPLTSRLLSVTGFGLEKPFNINALIGTPFSELAQLAQPKSALNYPLIMGGPMMGFKVKSNDVPIIKTTNCVLANPPEPTEMQMPCIRCGECMDACPVNLLPQQMYWHSQAQEYAKVEKLNVVDCIECGCCSYVCPSHIPLVQYYRNAKSEIKAIHAEEKAVELAKQRHEFRLARIEREKQEREARLKAKKEAVKKQALAGKIENTVKTDDKAKAKPAASKAAAAAAAAKAAAARRKAASKDTDDNASASNADRSASADKSTTKIPAARMKAIEAAKKAAAAKAANAEQAGKTSKNSSANKPKDANNAKAAAKQAAMSAAKKRAEAKKAIEEATDLTPTESVKQAHAHADNLAKKAASAAVSQVKQNQEDSRDFKQVNENITDLTQVTEETNASRKEKARRAAIAASLAANKTADSDAEDNNIQATEVEKPVPESTGTEDKKARAMRLAKEAAAKRAAKKKAEREASKAQSNSSDKENS